MDAQTFPQIRYRKTYLDNKELDVTAWSHEGENEIVLVQHNMDYTEFLQMIDDIEKTQGIYMGFYPDWQKDKYTLQLTENDKLIIQIYFKDVNRINMSNKHNCNNTVFIHCVHHKPD